MTQIDMQKLEVAMKYIERIADGKNPVNNKPTEEDAVLNNPNVIRCMYFVKEVLAAVKENDGLIGGKPAKPQKTPFPFECLSDFQYVGDTSISHFLSQLKGLAQNPQVRGIGSKPVTDWLKKKEYLVDVLDRYTGKMRPQVTESGTVFGLYMEERSSMRGEPYNIIMYSQRAQEFIAANLEKIVNNSI